MTYLRHLTLAMLGATLGCCAASPPGFGSGTPAPGPGKPRVVVTADPELDDTNSLVRYLLYSTDFRTEGLVYASSQFHWKGDDTGKKWFVPGREYTRFGLNLGPMESWRWASGERFIDDAVETYEKVYPNLRVHDPNYPTPAELKSKIRWGNVAFDGDISKDSPGSDLIKGLLLDEEPGPIYLLAWGGQSTIARALKSIQDQYQGTAEWPAIARKVTRKAILSPSGDQDDTYAKYIRPNWPDIKTLRTGRGGVALAYGANSRASADNAVYYSADWTRENITSKGPFGALYRVWGDGKQMVKGDIFDYFGLSGQTADKLQAKGYIVWLPPRPKGEFLGEGDTFTYLNLIDNGLRGYEDETPGGWSGHGLIDGVPRANARRAGPAAPQDAGGLGKRPAAGRPGSGVATPPPSPVPNFTPAVQNGLAARLRWSVTPRYADANHTPKVRLRGSSRISARPGATVRLEGDATDPDRNRVSVKWWQWKEVDTYPGAVSLADPTALVTNFRVPADAKPGQTVHLILEATDDGTPPLTRYQRIVLTVAE